jgi:hypothetical protein
MNRITLISTAHKKKGMCNSNELLKIINMLSPDVIYEELSPNLFSSFYEKQGNSTLETIAIKKYLESNPIPHIPVDMNGDELLNIEFKNKISNVLNLFNHSPQYRNLSIHHDTLTFRVGFPYLNSKQCIDFYERSNFLEKILIKQIGRPELIETYEQWLNINERRENSMIKNIYEYGNKYTPTNALFLVGSAHRKSIIKKAEEAEKVSEIKFNWILNSI